jgi:hypothetical protein
MDAAVWRECAEQLLRELERDGPQPIYDQLVAEQKGERTHAGAHPGQHHRGQGPASRS